MENIDKEELQSVLQIIQDTLNGTKNKKTFHCLHYQTAVCPYGIIRPMRCQQKGNKNCYMLYTF